MFLGRTSGCINSKGECRCSAYIKCTPVLCNIKWRKIEIKIKINKRTLEPWKIPPLQTRGSCPLDPRKFSNSGALACHFPRFFSIISLHIRDSDEVLNISQCYLKLYLNYTHSIPSSLKLFPRIFPRFESDFTQT